MNLHFTALPFPTDKNIRSIYKIWARPGSESVRSMYIKLPECSHWHSWIIWMVTIPNLKKTGEGGLEERGKRRHKGISFLFSPFFFNAYVLLVWKRNRKRRMCKNRCGTTKPPHRLLEKEDVHKEQSVWPLKCKLIQKEDMKKCYSKHIIHRESWDVYNYPIVAGN